MKKCFLILIVIFITIFLAAEESLKDWSCSKPIELTGKNKYKFFFLDSEVYRYANDNLSDLRIIDNANNFVPYYINQGYSIERKDNIKFESVIINKSNEKEKDKTYINSITDFQVMYYKNDYSANYIQLEIAGAKEYSSQINIYSRDEKTEWQLLAKDTIYNINNYKKDTIDLDYSTSQKFFRIIILNNKDNLEIKRCIPISNSNDKTYNSYKDKTDLKFDVKVENNISKISINNPSKLKILLLNLTIQDNFNRNFDLCRKNDSLITSGNIYNFKYNDMSISNLKIDLHESWERDENLILKIYNNSDKPLKIEKIDAGYLKDQIVFETKENYTYKIYFGNSASVKPSYDIVSFMNYIEKEKKDQAALGKLTILKEKEIKKENKNYKTIYNVVIILISILLIFFLIRLLKKK